MRHAATVLMPLVLLAACGRGQEATKAPPPPVETPAVEAPSDAVDFSRDLNALGNEPFWAVKIRADGLTFSAPDQADLTAPNAGPAVEGVKATWTGEAEGRSLVVTLTSQVCQDGMSGLLYPFTAHVELGGTAFEGCGAYADAMPREGLQ